MSTTIYRYLFREMAAPFLLGMASFTFVLLMGRMLKLADLVVSKGVPFTDMLRLVGYMLPSFSLVSIPMAFLLAVMLAFGRLSADSELTAIKASGVSLYGLLPPVLSFAALAYLSTTIVSVYALPWGNTEFKKLLFDLLESRATLNIKERVFNDEFPGMVIYIDRYQRERQQFTGVLIHDERQPDEPSTIFAESGLITKDAVSRQLRVHLSNGSIHRNLPHNGYRLIEFNDYDMFISLYRANREVSLNELDMSLEELRQGIGSTTTSASLRRDYRLELQRRFSLPFACIVFALIGVPLGMQNRRAGKAGGFSMSILILLSYYILLSTGRNLGEKGLVSPMLAMWAPNVIFLAMSGYFYRLANADQPLPFQTLYARLTGWLESINLTRKSRP